MPRIRTLKPEHKQHRKVGALSHFLYRLWVGLVTEADDYGRLVADPAQLRILIFPYHPKIRAQHVQIGLEDLARAGLCQCYVVDNVPYAALPSWADHQKVSHPAKSPIPAPPNGPPPEDSRILARLPGGSEGSEGLEGSDRKRRPRALGGAPAGSDPVNGHGQSAGSPAEFMSVVRAAANRPVGFLPPGHEAI